MKRLTTLLFSLCCTGCILAAPPANVTQRIPQFENDDILVWKTTIYPKSPLKMHHHGDARLVVGVKGGRLKKLESTGEISYLDFPTGTVTWVAPDPPQTEHACINETDEPIEIMVIQFKNK